MIIATRIIILVLKESSICTILRKHRSNPRPLEVRKRTMTAFPNILRLFPGLLFASFSQSQKMLSWSNSSEIQVKQTSPRIHNIYMIFISCIYRNLVWMVTCLGIYTGHTMVFLKADFCGLIQNATTKKPNWIWNAWRQTLGSSRGQGTFW